MVKKENPVPNIPPIRAPFEHRRLPLDSVTIGLEVCIVTFPNGFEKRTEAVHGETNSQTAPTPTESSQSSSDLPAFYLPTACFTSLEIVSAFEQVTSIRSLRAGE
jgi:hypothetical protein